MNYKRSLRQLNFDKNLFFASIPKRYAKKSFKDLILDHKETVNAVNTVKKYISNFESMLSSGVSGFFSGNVGTGKTLLGCMIVKGVVIAGYKAKYTTAWRMIQNIRTAYRDQSTSVTAMVEKYIALDLLVIDEVGVQRGSEDERVLLYQVVDGRYNNVKPTILISNSKNPVKDGYIDLRTIDRLKEAGGFSIIFTRESFRKEKSYRR